MISKLLNITLLCQFYLHVARYLIVSTLENKLLFPEQSGFRPVNSCINQLLSINFEILNVFDKGIKVCGIFFDISRAFDTV